MKVPENDRKVICTGFWKGEIIESHHSKPKTYWDDGKFSIIKSVRVQNLNVKVHPKTSIERNSPDIIANTLKKWKVLECLLDLSW